MQKSRSVFQGLRALRSLEMASVMMSNLLTQIFKKELKESSTCYKSTPLKVSEANFNV